MFSSIHAEYLAALRGAALLAEGGLQIQGLSSGHVGDQETLWHIQHPVHSHQENPVSGRWGKTKEATWLTNLQL